MPNTLSQSSVKQGFWLKLEQSIVGADTLWPPSLLVGHHLNLHLGTAVLRTPLAVLPKITRRKIPNGNYEAGWTSAIKEIRKITQTAAKIGQT